MIDRNPRADYDGRFPEGSMKRIVMFACAIALASALPAAAQGMAPPKSMAEGLQRAHAGAFRNLIESAEKMPEADYTFVGAKDIRTFGGFVGHVINSSYGACSRAKGEPNPNKADFEKAPPPKAKLVEAIKAVSAYCDAVYNAQTDATLAEMIPQGQGQVPRGVVLLNNIAHNNNEYGQIVLVLRLKGIVPPSTERATAGRGGRGPGDE
jgi:uncharacterized damage-inducible protein DinB